MLEVVGLNTEYKTPKGPPVKAAQDVSFEVPQGKLFTLLGPSGCGKTTTLRSIAGLERPVSGEIEVDGAPVYSSTRHVLVPPNRRNFGMVFQSYAIWPHMNVLENAAFPLRVGRARLSRKEIQDKVMRVLAAVGLDHLAAREATRLSGGQQQRLALARALVMEPRLLLLDEPLSNLDAKLRERMRFELKRIQRELGLTTVYVTHDQSEALALSHEIAVMNEGRIVQIGSPRDIYERPASKFVADFIGSTNFLDARILGRADARWALAGGDRARPAHRVERCDAAPGRPYRGLDPAGGCRGAGARAGGRRSWQCRARHRRPEDLPRRVRRLQGQGRRLRSAGPRASLGAHADRRGGDRAHEPGQVHRDRGGGVRDRKPDCRHAAFGASIG